MAGLDGAARGGWVERLRRTGHYLLRIPLPLAWGLVAAWMGLIWFLSSRPGEPGGLTGGWAVVLNFGHAPVFGFLALLFAAALFRSPAGGWPRLGPREVAWVVGGVALYGLIDEWHQSSVVGRDSSVLDVLTDVVGAACVLWIIGYLGRSDADERGLRSRFVLGLLFCMITASLGVPLFT